MQSPYVHALIGLMVAMGVLAVTASGATHLVPGEYGSIQAAVDVSSNGDSVLVSPGTYAENVTVTTNVAIVSSDGAATTTIDGGFADAAIKFDYGVGAGAMLVGFTVERGLDDFGDAGGVRVLFSSPVVRDNVISGNSGPGMSARGAGTPLFENNTVTGNGTGYYHWASGGIVRDNVISGNAANGIELWNSPPTIIEGNVIVDNGEDGICGTIPSVGFTVQITGNTIAGNLDGIALTIYTTAVSMQRNLISNNDGNGIKVDNDLPVLACNNIWQNVFGDYSGIVAGGTDISIDPLYCDPPGADYRVADGSECLAKNSPCGQLIGALGEGCALSPTLEATWTDVKANFRR